MRSILERIPVKQAKKIKLKIIFFNYIFINETPCIAGIYFVTNTMNNHVNDFYSF